VVLDATDEAAVHEFARAVVRRLSDTPRWLPCYYLYDARGSELFERITAQPEYYLTRTENAILADSAQAIREITGPVTLIELGSGSSVKTDHLLAAYTTGGESLRYVPVDVSESALRAATAAIAARHPDVDPTGIVGRYEVAFPQFREHSPCMVLFLGSTVGNLNRDESLVFWADLSENLMPGDFVLLGADLVKDEALLNAAYNDQAGVTAQFTKNIFRRINRDLGANVDLEQIEHVARYNPEWQRIEISVRFLTDQAVYVEPLGQTVSIAAGDEVMTEISRKFVLDDFVRYLAAFGLRLRRAFTDERNWFAVLLLERESGQ
jgi:L-histidine N-alpha-methyltransferase